MKANEPSPDVAGIVERLLTLKGYSDRVVARFVQEAAQALTTLASDNKALGEERDEARRRLAASLTAAAKAWETAGVDALGIDRTHLFRRENDDPAEYEALLRAARRATDAELRAESAEARVKALEEALKPFANFAMDNTDGDGWAGNRCERDRIADWFGPSDFQAVLAALSAQEGK
jgi:hypothetical protein